MSTSSTRVRRRVPRIVFLLLLLVPIAEIAVLIGMGKVIGGWPTVGLLVFESLLGAWLVKKEGKRAWQALSEANRTGRLPSRELADGALILVGGTLLLAPGFLTDIVGFFFILPFTRPMARKVLERFLRRRMISTGWSAFGMAAGAPGASYGGFRTATFGDVIEGEVIDETDARGASPRRPLR